MLWICQQPKLESKPPKSQKVPTNIITALKKKSILLRNIAPTLLPAPLLLQLP